MNSIKNKKLSSLFYIEIAEILQKEFHNKIENKKGFFITLIKVCINSNMEYLKVYIGIYPFLDQNIVKEICSKSKIYRKKLSQKLRYRVKKIPILHFYIT
ncbi:ribosome-binding factor A [Blattabacterium cuenoti]|uniref:ribosome-binding factor A n=1 Tax=Blattabacterium cuenoti TaxID=1653831 RepID=UPI00163CF692|nr:ribosome-binding factor A [Blattabacterium cuenoti]